MAHGETDADEPDGHPLLPRADRVWRHPAEVALEAREAAARRRSRRRRRIGTSVLGVTGAAALLWITQSGPTDVTISSDIVPVGSADDAATSTSLADALLELDPGPDGLLLVRAADSAETLAGAVAIREGYVITSSQAIGGAEHVLITSGDASGPGTVVGHDTATDIAVVRLESSDGGATPAGADAPGSATPVGSGDVVRIVLQSGEASHQRVVEPMSATAKADGAPIIGVVELDGRIGEIVPGSPAYDDAGTVVGVATSTADRAPAALLPIDVARAVADDIIEHGVATHTWLGVRARTAEGEPTGSLVTAVTDGGPADLGGVETGDVIVSIGQNPVDSMEAMVALLRTYEPEATISVRVDRDGVEVTCVVSLTSADHAA